MAAKSEVGLTLLLATLLSCTPTAKKTVDLPVLVINGDVYSASAFGHDLAKKLKNFDALAAKDPTNVKRAKEAALREFTVQTLLTQYARAHQISVTNDELSAEFDRVRKSYPDDLTFKAALASDGQALDDWRSGLGTGLLEKKVFESLEKSSPQTLSKEALEEKARAYYASHKSEFDHPAQIHLQQIVVAKEDDAERLSHKLHGGASFSDLAKKFSISPDGAQGGDIGFISKGLVPAFDGAFNLRPGQLSGVVKSSYGFHIMKVLDKRSPGVIAYDQARAGIIRRLSAQRQQEVFTSWLDKVIKESKTERNDVLIDKIKIRTEGKQE